MLWRAGCCSCVRYFTEGRTLSDERQGSKGRSAGCCARRASERTADANVHIQRAERLQRKARNTWCFLMLIAGGVLGVLLLILLA